MSSVMLCGPDVSGVHAYAVSIVIPSMHVGLSACMRQCVVKCFDYEHAYMQPMTKGRRTSATIRHVVVG